MKRLFVLMVGILLLGCGEPDIEVSCHTNGFGQGECVFTNKGTAEGTKEVTVKVENRRTGKSVSTTVHSGIVPKGDVRERKVTLVGLSDVCDVNSGLGGSKYNLSWTDVCYFLVL